MADLSADTDDGLDLDYGELGADPNGDAVIIEATRYERTGPPPHAVPGYDWAAYFRGIREAREAEGTFDPGGARTVIETHYDSAPTLPSAPARLLLKLTEGGWQVRVQESRVLVDALLYVGNTDSHAKGDLRAFEHEEAYWALQGVLEASGERVATFWATWTRNEGASKPGNKFESAVTWDAALGVQPNSRVGDFTEWLEILTP